MTFCDRSFGHSISFHWPKRVSAYSAQIVGALVGGLLVGRVQHRVGRKPTLALIGCGCGLVLAGGALVYDLTTLILQRLALGLFMGAVFPATIDIVVDLFPARQRGRLASMIDATYFGAVIALGWVTANLAGTDWQLLFWPVGVLMVILGMSAFALSVPNHSSGRSDRAPRILDLFSPELRRKTMALTAMISANASGHQAFVGWMTVYLLEVARVSTGAMAATISALYVGSISGCFAWGYIADRFGRKACGRGLLAAAVFVILFLVIPGPLWAKQIAAFCYGFSFAAVVMIGPLLAEQYPPNLRGPATSIFHWGRFVSLFAPPVTGALAAAMGLPFVMALSALAFVLGGLVWRKLPETHRSDHAPA